VAVVRGRVCPNPASQDGFCSEHADFAGKQGVVGVGLVPAADEQPPEPEPPEPPRTTNDVRGELRRLAEENLDALEQLYLESLTATKTIAGKCSCGRWVHVPSPDWTARLKAAELLVRQGYGRDPEVSQPAAGLSARAAELNAELEAMTDDELVDYMALSTAKDLERLARFGYDWPADITAAMSPGAARLLARFHELSDEDLSVLAAMEPRL
jgi:hypothetical protein